MSAALVEEGLSSEHKLSVEHRHRQVEVGLGEFGFGKAFDNYRTPVPCGIVVAVDVQLGEPPEGDLLYVRHEVVWDPPGIFADSATLMCPDWIEVSQQNDPPLGFCPLDVLSDFFQEKLTRANRTEF